MTTRQQSSRRRPPHRLLLLTGLGIGAGIGIALAVSGPAHAADNPPTPDTSGITGTLSDTLDLPGRIIDSTPPQDQPQAPRPSERPTPVRDAITGTRAAARQTADTTGRTVKHATDRVDAVTAPLPAVGEAVDNATDVTDHIVDTATAPPALPIVDGNPATPILTPIIGDWAGTGDQAGIPQTTPEPAPHGAPTPDGASSGVPTAAPQHPTWSPAHAGQHSATPTTRDGKAHHRTAAANPRSDEHRRPGGTLGAGHDANPPATPGTRTMDCTTSGTWTGAHLWQQAITDYTSQHSGRTHPPSQPSG